MAELADAYGSGPYFCKEVQVQVLSGAPDKAVDFYLNLLPFTIPKALISLLFLTLLFDCRKVIALYSCHNQGSELPGDKRIPPFVFYDMFFTLLMCSIEVFLINALGDYGLHP